MDRFKLTWGRYNLTLGQRTCVMGIVNVTPDSFSDGGMFFNPQDAIDHGLELVRQGADIIDIGGESTRPYADPVDEAEELRRVIPVIEALVEKTEVPISIDTTKVQVARRALEAGAAMINDIGALTIEPELGKVAADFDVPLILMHMQGQPRTMQDQPRYGNLLEEIRQFLLNAINAARQQGVALSRLIVDPGIGFGKSVSHNLKLIANLDYFRSLKVPLLIGTSRKSFIRNTLKTELYNSGDVPDHAIETGTQATVAASILSGAHIVRVHDVANTQITCRLVDGIKNG
jgi:dihydropteroate synthase